MVQEEHSVEVIHLVAKGARQQVFPFMVISLP